MMVGTGIDNPFSANSERRKTTFVLGMGAIAIALGFYLRLFHKVGGRPDVFAFFFHWLLPVALGHTALFFLFTLTSKRQARDALIFWSISLAALLASGGWTCTEALVLIVIFGFVLAGVGGVFARQLFPSNCQGWALSLALGILFLSAVGTYLAWMHFFKWWVLAILILAVLALDIRSAISKVLSQVQSSWSSFQSSWNLPQALALQGLFLLGVYAFVLAMAPETNSDAIRFYWPFIKLMRHYSGFFNEPRQWSYFIPQAGLVYGAAALSLVGKHAVRLAMLLAWASLIGVLCRRWTTQESSPQYTVVLVVASCPVILWVATSLMQDIFVCLAVVTLMWICLEGQDPGSHKFWISVGIFIGIAWAAKYTTLAYAVPLLGFAVYRSYSATGWIKTLRGLALSGCSALITITPWLVRSYQQVGNPVFPFLSEIFPSSLWPRGVGFANLASFRLPAGWRGWLLWPIDLTYHTSRFVEGHNGKLGLTLIVLLILAIPALRKGSGLIKSIVITGTVGTVLLWSQTAYLRYWLPGLWLLGMAAAYTLQRHLRSISQRLIVAVAALAILVPQVLFNMVDYFPDPRGWPWKAYAGEIRWEDLVGQRLWEVEQLLPPTRPWPKIWATGYEPVGHLDVEPMEATVWELSLHATEPRAKIQYLASAGCEYWLVNEEDEDAKWFRSEGISHFFWKQSNFVARAGAMALYRMPSAERALQEFDARALPGTDLLMNGSFELTTGKKPAFWLIDGNAEQYFPAAEADQGQACLRLPSKGGVRQGIALPPGIRNLELVANARSGGQGEPVELHYSFYFEGFEKDPQNIPPKDQVQPYHTLTGRDESVHLGGKWEQYRSVLAVPDLARYAVVGLDRPAGKGEIWIDSVHVYVR
jgi:hypothetical protein